MRRHHDSVEMHAVEDCIRVAAEEDQCLHPAAMAVDARRIPVDDAPELANRAVIPTRSMYSCPAAVEHAHGARRPGTRRSRDPRVRATTNVAIREVERPRMTVSSLGHTPGHR